MAKLGQNRLSNILQDQNVKILSVVANVLVFPFYLLLKIFKSSCKQKLGNKRKPVWLDWLVGPA